MKDDRDRRERQTGGSAKNPRRDRLKLALRENLKRRKSQARGRSDVTAGPPNPDEGSPHYVDGKKTGKKPGLACGMFFLLLLMARGGRGGGGRMGGRTMG